MLPVNKLMCVVGSGPSGIACAHTLLKAGHTVVLLDVGFTLENEAQHLLDKYTIDQDTVELTKNIHELRRGHHKHSKDQPLKTLFGSAHPYKMLEDTLVEPDKNAVVRSSLAKGGFSTVWGATVGVAAPKDIASWPITFDELKPFYRSLDELLDVSAIENEMPDIFPMNIGQPPTFPLGVQASELLNRLQQSGNKLANDGIFIGRAKVAIGPKYSIDGKGCTPCGLCMHGCPNSAIFNSAFVLDRLQHNNNFRWQPNALVERFCEEKNQVKLRIKDVRSGARWTLVCDRVFLGCGVINTTSIVARSLSLTNHTFTIKDSQKYIFPTMLWHRSKGAMRKKENTSAQIYMDVDNPSISSKIVHLQYYGYNDLYLEPLRNWLGIYGTTLVERLLPAVLERIMMCFVYLHSDESGTMTLAVNEQDHAEQLMGRITGHSNPRSEKVMKSLLALLRRHHRDYGGIPIGLGLKSTLPGDSQHIGGTLPMATNPNRFETDIYGRPYGCRRVHVVDASVLPSIPATPIVFTTMANACRIAQRATKEKDRREDG